MSILIRGHLKSLEGYVRKCRLFICFYIDSIRSLNSIVSGIQGILKEREYEFLLLRYKEGLTLQEVGSEERHV